MLRFLFVYLAAERAFAAQHVLATVRADLLAAGSSADALEVAASKLFTAEQSCSADADGKALALTLADVRGGYERLSTLLKAAPADLIKLEKALTKARKKKLDVAAEANDDEELVSKAEKAARAAKLAKAEAAESKAADAVDSEKAARAVREPRTVLMSSLAQSVSRVAPALASVLEDTGPIKKPVAVPVTMSATATPKLQVLHRSPLVLALDDWLGPVGLAALDGAADAMAAALNASDEGAVAVATNASELGEEGEYQGSPPTKPALCLPLVDDAPDAALLKTIADEIAKAKKAKAKALPHCGATAALVEEAPEGWDEKEDGAFVGLYKAPADRFGKAQQGCGPLTGALDAALVSSDAVTFTASSDASVDVLDAAIAEVLGFSLAAEALGGEVVSGLRERVDASAVAPDDWDASEDGPWEAPMLPGQTAEELWKEVISRGGDNASGLGEAYGFSSSPILVRSRAGGGREGLAHDCDYFGAGEPRAAASVVALLQLSPTLKKGGETTLPALGLSVAPVRGRLLLIETALPDGACDPASARGSTSLPASAPHKLVLQKTFYADRTFSRAERNSEGPQRGVAKVDCAALGGRLGCRRFEHIPAKQGAAVLPLRELRTARACLPASAAGACIDENYVPPPPPPKKQKKPKAALVEPPATPTPVAPMAPGAPPPVAR